MFPDATPQTPMDRLLGGWSDILDDVGKLQRRVERVPGRCTCGHVAGVETGCPCCEHSNRALGLECRNCAVEIDALASRLERVEEDTLRFLPAMTDLFASTPERFGQFVALEQSIAQLLATFHRLVSATGEFRSGCPASHLPAVRSRARDVGIASARLSGVLDSLPEGRA